MLKLWFPAWKFQPINIFKGVLWVDQGGQRCFWAFLMTPWRLVKARRRKFAWMIITATEPAYARVNLRTIFAYNRGPPTFRLGAPGENFANRKGCGHAQSQPTDMLSLSRLFSEKHYFSPLSVSGSPYSVRKPLCSSLCGATAVFQLSLELHPFWCTRV